MSKEYCEKNAKICEKITKDLQRDVANFGNIPYNMYRPFFRHSIFLCEISKTRDRVMGHGVTARGAKK